jgi:hypothetical protein
MKMMEFSSASGRKNIFKTVIYMVLVGNNI